MYRRNLPHWRAKDAVYFVTFRLADSIPGAVLDRWRDERETWLMSYGLNGRLSRAGWKRRYGLIPENVRVAFERHEARRLFIELDRGHGKCQLRHPEAAAIVAGALRFHDGSRLRCGDFVVMPNHVHWLIQPLHEELLEKLLQSVKQFSCKGINRWLGRRGTLWQGESHDHIVRDREELGRIRKYIADNPAKVGLREGEYFYYQGDAFDPDSVGPIP